MLYDNPYLKALYLFLAILLIHDKGYSQNLSYQVVDTKVSDFTNESQLISEPREGDPFYGQDATYYGNQPSYTDHGDGTITDNISGLTWEKDMGVKISYADAFSKADTMTLGGKEDWRVPTLKELYSLILFTNDACRTIKIIKI